MSARGDQPSASHSADFVHQLRNRLFAMSALFDVLELRAEGSPAIARYLPHLRLELSRLEQFASDWPEVAAAEPGADPPPRLLDVLAAAIARVSEDAALRDVLLSLVSEPDSHGVVRRPALVTAALALLLDEMVRAAPAGTHVWLRVVRGPRGDAAVALHAEGVAALEGIGVELARAALRSIGGGLEAGGGLEPGGSPDESPARAVALVHLGTHP